MFIVVAGFGIRIALVMKISVFWDVMPFNVLKIDRRLGRMRRLLLYCCRIAVFGTCFMLVSRLAYSLTLKMEATYSSEISGVSELRIATTQRTTDFIATACDYPKPDA
jgi:dolichyl-phosphate-mannose--protein O-mannosyl transferase